MSHNLNLILKKLCLYKAFFISSLFTLSFFSACSVNKTVGVISGETMGTTYSIKIGQVHKKVELKLVKAEVDVLLKELNRQMSTYQKDSEISKLNKASMNTNVEISSWFYEVLSYSLKLAEQTDGFYDPTLGPLVNLWGFGPSNNRKAPNALQIKRAQENIGFEKVVLSKVRGKFFAIKKRDKVYVDLSSSAKGFAVDKVSELLIQRGVKNHLVEIGGELRASGKKFKKDWVVAVERPSENTKGIQKAFAIKDLSIATSGDYRNFFKENGRKYSHTIDKVSGKPVEHKMFSVSVLETDCMKADALATALMSLGPDKAKNYAYENDLAVYLIYENKEGKLKEHESPKFSKLTK